MFGLEVLLFLGGLSIPIITIGYCVIKFLQWVFEDSENIERK